MLFCFDDKTYKPIAYKNVIFLEKEGSIKLQKEDQSQTPEGHVLG